MPTYSRSSILKYAHKMQLTQNKNSILILLSFLVPKPQLKIKQLLSTRLEWIKEMWKKAHVSFFFFLISN